MQHHPFFPFVACAIISTILFLLFFPPAYVSGDEHQYYKNAILIQNDQLKSADPLLYCGGTYKGEDYVSTYHIGKSFSLIPFTWLPFPFILISGLIIHLLNAGIFALILRKLNIHAWLVSVFMFYPAFVWESRTLFSETFALTLLLGGLFFYLDKNVRSLFIAGFLFGLAALVRYETILISLSFAIVLLWKERHSLIVWKKNHALFFMFGGIISAALLFAWNAWYNGGALATQIDNPLRILSGVFGPHFAANLLKHTAILLIAFPLMLLAPIRFPALKWELITASSLTLLFFSIFSNISVFQFFSPLTLTGRMRYFIPIAGLLIVAYAGVLSAFIPRILERFGKSKFFMVCVGVGIILLTGTFTLHAMHQTLLEKRASVLDDILAHTEEGSLIIGSADDCIYFLPPLSGARQYVKVNDPHQDVDALIAMSKNPVYVLQLRYTNTSDSEVRQNVIDAERKAIDDFIASHATELTTIYSTQAPHALTIYQYNP